MPKSSMFVHLIWSTKNRKPLINKDLKTELLNFIESYCKENAIKIVAINCVEDHIHILISLGTGQMVAKIVRLIKGSSSFWVNKNNLSKIKFEWQTSYISVSLSLTSVSKVKQYISNQEEHHRKVTFQEEYDKFIKGYGLQEE